MGIGVSLFLLAVGAILTFTVTGEPFGAVSIDTVGIILMIVGGLGLLLTLLFFGSSAPYRRDRTVVREERDVL